MENDNKRLHEWMFHDVVGAEWTDCKSVFADHSNPRYNEESGFFALLSGLRAKGFDVTIETHELYKGSSDFATVWIRLSSIEGVEPTVYANTLPEALFQAAIAAMTSEEKAD